jgi:RNA polymerase sigma factor (sigma-70 family)
MPESSNNSPFPPIFPILPILQDEDLMEAYQGGHISSFAELYRRHVARVHGYLRRRIDNPATVEDVCQMTFAKLHQARAQFSREFRFTQWLYSIARSVLRDHFRRESRRLELDHDIQVDGLAAPVLLREESTGDIREILEVLREDQRRIVEWRVLEELSYEEIARRTSLNPVHVRQVYHRALGVLRAFKREAGSPDAA